MTDTTCRGTPGQARTEPWRRSVTIILIVVTSLAGLGAVLGTWAHQTLYDTDQFMSAVEPTLEDPEFYENLSTFASAQIIEALDIETRLTERLGAIDDMLRSLIREAIDPGELLDRLLGLLELPTFVSLAPGIAEAIEAKIETATRELITSGPARVTVPALIERAHYGLVALAVDDFDRLPDVYLADDGVRYNLLPFLNTILTAVLGQIGDLLPDVDLPPILSERVDEALEALRAELGQALPDNFGQLRIMSTETLDTIQGASNQIRGTIWTWVIVTVLLAVATIYLATNRRRAGIYLGLGFVGALVVGSMLLSYFEGLLAEALGTADGQLIRTFLVDLFSNLRMIVIILILIALVTATVARFASGRSVDTQQA